MAVELKVEAAVQGSLLAVSLSTGVLVAKFAALHGYSLEERPVLRQADFSKLLCLSLCLLCPCLSASPCPAIWVIWAAGSTLGVDFWSCEDSCLHPPRTSSSNPLHAIGPAWSCSSPSAGHSSNPHRSMLPRNGCNGLPMLCIPSCNGRISTRSNCPPSCC